MKTIIAALMLLISTGALAHSTQVGCNVQGRVKIMCSDFADGTNNFVKVHISIGVFGNGTSDTIFQLPASNAFDIYVPQADPNLPVAVTFQNTDATGLIPGDIHIIQTGTCRSLGLKFGAINVLKMPRDRAYVTFEVYNVVNVKEIQVMVSVGSRKYEVKATIQPDQGEEKKTYAAYIDLKN